MEQSSRAVEGPLDATVVPPAPKRAKQCTPAAPMVWPRADPAELARFDPRTKVCSMNCGPSSDDPRSANERALLCDECWEVAQ